MDQSLILMIRERVAHQSNSIAYPCTSKADVEEAEMSLGFDMPALLKLCYLTVANGGFGPGYGIIGVKGGYSSDYGSLVDTYRVLKGDQESAGKTWKTGLLPFCEWGCNIFSCVDCNEPHHPVWLFEDFEARSQNYTLDGFFKMWIDGVDILAYKGEVTESAEIINPFTGNKIRVSKRHKE